MLNIVVPMAGLGSRFAVAGYTTPKPLIPINGTPMVRLVVENLRPRRPHRFVFICQREHVARYGLSAKLAEWAPGSSLVQLDGVTEGAACTVLTAEAEVDPAQPLMIANSDQYIDASIDDYLGCGDAPGVDGLIMTMWAADPKWSFVEKVDGRVTRVVEKEVISNDATVGIYNFARAGDFFDGARAMIAQDARVNGEFYVAPVYNALIERGARIETYSIGQDGAGMHGLGTPSDLDAFLALPLAQRAAKVA